METRNPDKFLVNLLDRVKQADLNPVFDSANEISKRFEKSTAMDILVNYASSKHSEADVNAAADYEYPNAEVFYHNNKDFVPRSQLKAFKKALEDASGEEIDENKIIEKPSPAPIQEEAPQPTINVAGGEAKFVKTEVEDSQGNWNDNYNVRDGYYVIHQGAKHHVYKLMKENLTPQADTAPVGEAETDKYSVVARGISAEEIAKKIAQEKKGVVQKDDQDDKKFMVVVKESEEPQKPTPNDDILHSGVTVKIVQDESGKFRWSVPDAPPRNESYETRESAIEAAKRYINECPTSQAIASQEGKSEEEVEEILRDINVDFSKYDLQQLLKGIKVEKEHSASVGGGLKNQMKIAIDHLNELPDYYDRLEKMEATFKECSEVHQKLDQEKGKAYLSELDKLYQQYIKGEFDFSAFKEKLQSLNKQYECEVIDPSSGDLGDGDPYSPEELSQAQESFLQESPEVREPLLAITEKAPAGWEGTVLAMKKNKNIENPWALAWYMKNKGYKSRKKEETSESGQKQWQCIECGKKFNKQVPASGEVKCPSCGSTDIDVDEKVQEDVKKLLGYLKNKQDLTEKEKSFIKKWEHR